MFIGFVVLEKVTRKKINRNLLHYALNRGMLERNQPVKDKKIKKKEKQI